MSRLYWRVALATAAFVSLAIPAAWGQDEAETEPCQKACYEQMDTCSEVCTNEVENNLCQQECLDKKDDCIEKCS